MLDSIQTSYITTRKTYLLTCEACQEGREVHSSELPCGSEAYSYQCPCGEISEVRLVGSC
jgi:hypothetical protein